MVPPPSPPRPPASSPPPSVVISLELVATTASFDAQSFQSGLAARLGLVTSELSLDVAPRVNATSNGTLAVTATAPATAAATAAAEEIAQADAAELSSLSTQLGVEVRQVIYIIIYVPAPSVPPSPLPPPAAPPPAPPRDDLLTMVATTTAAAVVVCLCCSVCVLAALLRRQQRKTIRAAAGGVDAAACGASRMLLPPTCRWEVRGDYVCFLSHYKAEAGTDARYLHDLLQRMLGAKVFLDSEDLSDLSALFEHGVRRSDCLVLLATTSVLTRPWCLLELFEAHRYSVPVVVVTVEGRALSRDAARRFVLNLEAELEEKNPAGLREVRAKLPPATSLAQLKAALLGALDLAPPPSAGDGGGGPQGTERPYRLAFRPFGTGAPSDAPAPARARALHSRARMGAL